MIKINKSSNEDKIEQSTNLKLTYGITLISLVITIIILLILAGIVIHFSLSENGIFNKSKYARIEYEKSKIKEELELEIVDVQVEKEGKLTYKDISERFRNNAIVLNVDEEDRLEGEYKSYEFLVDENKNVIIGKKLEGERPTVLIGTALNEENGKIRIQVIGNVENSEIQAIEAISGATLVVQNSSNNSVFEVSENGEYKFRIVGKNGRIAIAKVLVNNELETVKSNSILEGISQVKSSGIKKLQIEGKQEEYSINTIIYEGDMLLDGNTSLIGSILKNNVYEFGNKSDVATSGQAAKNMVVLKVNGNLTINKGVTLTSCKSDSGYGGPKGMTIYCTGIFSNNGSISMTARGAKATGENIYLYRNENGTYECVPAIGAAGGASYQALRDGSNGNNGNNGFNRQTGGGGTGAGRSYIHKATISSGGTGTSYSGGSGSGAANADGASGHNVTSSPGSSVGGPGGNGVVASSNSSGYGQISIGGTGNPSGSYATYRESVVNYVARHGTGGLLVIDAETFDNQGTISANGVSSSTSSLSNTYGRVDTGGASGGGSINIFYKKILNRGTITANGGSSIRGEKRLCWWRWW